MGLPACHSERSEESLYTRLAQLSRYCEGKVPFSPPRSSSRPLPPSFEGDGRRKPVTEGVGDFVPLSRSI